MVSCNILQQAGCNCVQLAAESRMGTRREELGKDPLFRKYAKIARNDVDPEKKMKPSEFFKAAPNFNLEGYPKIIELNNMADNTADIRSSVDTDQPLFQASPKVVIFDNYAPFSVVERKLFFRNNDSVRHRMSALLSIYLQYILIIKEMINIEL